MKCKKIFSVLLSVLILASCFSSAFTVFAATKTENTAALIENFNGNMTIADPAAEDLAAYNEMVNSFNALSKEEIDNFDVFLFDKLLLAVYDREMALWKKENNSTSAANAYKAVHARAEGIITMPAYVNEAAALYVEANGINTQAKADAFIENLKNASINAVTLAGGYYNSYKAFRYSVSEKYGAELIDHAADKISTITQKDDAANKPSSPKSVSKPTANKYELGENDPAYIEAYKNYLAYKEAQADYYVARYVFEAEKHYFAALKLLVQAAPDFLFLYEFAQTAIEAKREFNETGSTEKITEAMSIYNKLSAAQKTWFETTDGYVFAEKIITKENGLGIEYGYNSLKLVDIADFCKSMEFFYLIKDFEDLIASLQAPYSNNDVAAVKKAYNEIPESIKDSVSSDALEKYKEILAAIGPDDASDEQPDLDGYEKTDVTFKSISQKDASTLADVTINLILKAAGVSDTKELINTKVLTNETVISLAALLYPLIEEKTDGLIAVSPASLAEYLEEEKFAGAVEALTAAGKDWAAVEIESGDFGFVDGDAEGFLDGAAAMLRGGSIIHVALTLENTKNTKEGTYTYGAYEDLIKLLEILDLKNVMSSDEYTNYVNSAEIKNDAKFRAILAPIVYLLVDFGNDPINTICDVLPKAAYAINSGILDKSINELISKIAILEIDPVDLTTSGIYGILNEKLLTPNNIGLSEEEFTSLISALAGSGEAVSKPSVQRGQQYRMGIESDKSSTIVILMSWLLGIARNNKELVNTLIDTLIADNALLNFALKLVINVSSTFIPERVVFMLMTIFMTLANFFMGIISIF